MYDRSMHWQSLKDSKINKQKKREQFYEVKEVTGKPNITPYKPSGRPKPTNQIKGVQQHMQRILEAKKKKIEEAEVFLLPSQKLQLKQQKDKQNREFLMNKIMYDNQDISYQ